MTNNVIQAEFAMFSQIPSRKVTKIVFEVPIEQTVAVATILSSPGTWCAIAPLDPNLFEDHKEEENHELSQKAAILCKDPEFQMWLTGYCGFDGTVDEQGARDILVNSLGISSRADLDTDEIAAAKFMTVVTTFEESQGRMAERFS